MPIDQIYNSGSNPIIFLKVFCYWYHYLIEASVQGNCLMHHDVLAPVSTLPRLRELDTRYQIKILAPSGLRIRIRWDPRFL